MGHMKSDHERREWACHEGLPYYPLSAKRVGSRAGVDTDSYHALVEWASIANADGLPLELSSQARRARLHLTRCCGLLVRDDRRPKMLRRAWQAMLTCPPEKRRTMDDVVAWASEVGLSVVASHADRLRSGLAQLAWTDTHTGQVLDKTKLIVPVDEVARFGGILSNLKPKQCTRTFKQVTGQQSLGVFFGRAATVRNSAVASTA